MKLAIYSIRDNKAEAYLRPFFERTNDTAIRAVKTAMQTDFGYPEDYALYSIGIFDDNNGQLETWPPEHITNLINLRDLEVSRTEAMMGKDYPDQKGNGEHRRPHAFQTPHGGE